MLKPTVEIWLNSPDSMPPSDRRWLLVARSADFADVGPMLGQRLTANHNSGYIFLHFADVGPTLGRHWANGGFLFKMVASNNRGFCET